MRRTAALLGLALLVGRIFSLRNLVAYAAGIALGVAIDWAIGTKTL